MIITVYSDPDGTPVVAGSTPELAQTALTGFIRGWNENHPGEEALNEGDFTNTALTLTAEAPAESNEPAVHVG